MLQHVPIPAMAPERFREVLTREQAAEWGAVVARASSDLAGHAIWSVNSTAHGGGVAEMLRSLIAYGRGAGVDARWVVIEGNPDFFTVTKRIHNRLHGAAGDGGPLGDEEREVYEAVTKANARELARLVAPGDVVLLHDPQTAGMTATLLETGVHVVWRCHVGIDAPDGLSRSAWAFLLPYVKPAEAYVFSREAFEWDDLDRERIAIIPPSIDVFAPKNQQLDPTAVSSIIHVTGITAGDHHEAATFTRLDGAPGRVDRAAKLWQVEPIPPHAPVVVQVSRWDALKDPKGVIESFARGPVDQTAAHLLLAGPDVSAVADDPEGLAVLNDCIEFWGALPPEIHARVHLAALPMEDPEENAAIVNAIQRHAAVVVQKSLAEGFGLTVAEAMWKGRPVVASRIGGIQDQIVDGESGVLVDPRNLQAVSDALFALLSDPERADRMGRAAQIRVRDGFLGSRHLSQYLDLFNAVVGSRPLSTIRGTHGSAAPLSAV